MNEHFGRLRPRHPFVWQSRLPRSKSWCNRALILRSWTGAAGSRLRICDGDQDLNWLDLGDDVARLAQALELARGEVADLGASGTGFRFYLARRSRDEGVHVVRGSARLLARPHQDLLGALQQMGVQIERGEEAWRIHSQGWREPQSGWLEVSAATSSQFASALLLSGIDLPFDLRLRVTGDVVSEGYLALTVQLLRQVGIDVQNPAVGEYILKRGQKLNSMILRAEPDLSTAATLAALGLADPESRVRFDADDEAAARDSLQPDREFWILAHKLREPLRRGHKNLRAISANLRGCPDLFPVLAALGALAEGTSTLQGAEHLRAKESDRVAGMVDLLRSLRLDVVEFPDGLAVTGLGGWAQARQHFAKQPLLRFDPREDHRLAFAAGVLALAGARLELTDRSVVKKSFPQFWRVLEGAAPRFCVAGHRGVGKSTALKRWRRWCEEVGVSARFVDLDTEIESRCGRSAAEIFSEEGEDEFRRLELITFNALARERSDEPLVLFVGGGFDVTQADASWNRVWLRRVTDLDDRIFVDQRPALGEGDEREVWRRRRDEREARFGKWAEHVIDLQEGAEQIEDFAERAIVLDLLNVSSFPEIGGVFTLTDPGRIEQAVKALRWGARLELRDDLVGDFATQDFHQLLGELPPGSRLLLSHRRSSNVLAANAARGRHKVDLDWPLEKLSEFSEAAAELEGWGEVRLVLSDHSSSTVAELEARVAEAFSIWSGETSRVWIKWAAPTSSFRELYERDQWRRAGPQRIFLPMSEDGRWKWYRLQCVPAEFQFWREGWGSAPDQPTAGEWLARNELQADFFAGVLGAPVAHSRTPLEHREFFSQYSWPVYAIRVERTEWGEARPVLRDLGLRAAAVTSPLKEVVAFDLRAPGGAVNSIVWDAHGEYLAATSTDAAWAKALIHENWAQLRPAVLWGGSGMIAAVKQMFPGVCAYSASKAQPRESQASPAPRLLIWGAGAQELKLWPWGEHRPSVVLDLSYQESSEARRVAKTFGAHYISGLELFDYQARAQRDFFRELIPSKV